MITKTRTQEERSNATRNKVLEGTIESLVEYGYSGTSTVDVCRRADVSRGAQLHHYPSKADLMAAAVEHLFDKRLAEFGSVLKTIPDTPDRVGAALSALWKIYSGPTLAAWMELVAAARTNDELRDSVSAVNDRFVEAAELAFARLFPGIEKHRVRPAARLLLATFDGLAMNRVMTPDDSLAKKTIKEFEALIRPWSRS